MFVEKNIIEFVSKIIDESNGDEKLKENITQFKDYLRLTKMGSEQAISWIEQVVDCLPEIMLLRKKVKSFDIAALIPFEGQEKVKTKQKTRQSVYEEKHYHHYESSSSDNCGSSSSANRRC